MYVKASQILATWLFDEQLVQADIKESIKICISPLWGVQPVTIKFSSQRASYAESFSMSWRHYEMPTPKPMTLISIV